MGEKLEKLLNNDNNIDDFLQEFSNAKEQYHIDHEYENLNESIENISTDEVFDSLYVLFPKAYRSSYTIDQDTLYVIDFIKGNLRANQISATRSDIINTFVSLIRIEFQEGDKYTINKDEIFHAETVNKNYFTRFLDVIKNEKDKEGIDKFGFIRTPGKERASFSISKVNINFLTDIAKSKNVGVSTMLNLLLGKLLFRDKQNR
jgi:hypothetical protein